MPREVRIPSGSQFGDRQWCTFGPSWQFEDLDMIESVRMTIVVELSLEEKLMGLFNLEGASGSKNLGILQATAARKNGDGVISFPGRNRIGVVSIPRSEGGLSQSIYLSSC